MNWLVIKKMASETSMRLKTFLVLSFLKFV